MSMGNFRADPFRHLQAKGLQSDKKILGCPQVNPQKTPVLGSEMQYPRSPPRSREKKHEGVFDNGSPHTNARACLLLTSTNMFVKT